MNDIDPSARLRAASAPAPVPELDPRVVAGAPERHAPRLVNRGRLVRSAAAGLGGVAALSAVAVVVGTAFPTSPDGPLFAAAGSSGAAESSALSADQRMMMWVDYDYVAGAGLDASSGRGSVYQLRLAGSAEDATARVAEAFAVDGTAREASYSAPEYPSWVVGPEDGTAPSAAVSWSGTGGWWYSNPDAYPEPVCEAVAYTNEDGTTGSYDDCRVLEVPAEESQAPSESEARELASALFAETGLSASGDDIRVTVDGYQTTATANLTVAGVATALEWSVSWSPLGEIAWASGHSVELVDRGGYDTVSAVEAVDRLEDGRWFGAAGPDYAGGAMLYAADSLARGAETPVEDAAAGAVSESPAEEVPGSEPTVEPAPEREPAPDPEPAPEPEILPEPEVLPVPEPEVVTVNLERADATLLLVWDVDGNAWLVPGYAYEQPEQGFWTAVISLVEGVITLPEPMTVDTLEG